MNETIEQKARDVLDYVIKNKSSDSQQSMQFDSFVVSNVGSDKSQVKFYRNNKLMYTVAFDSPVNENNSLVVEGIVGHLPFKLL